jgi:hypothetical protein
MLALVCGGEVVARQLGYHHEFHFFSLVSQVDWF